MNKSSEPFD